MAPVATSLTLPLHFATVKNPKQTVVYEPFLPEGSTLLEMLYVRIEQIHNSDSFPDSGALAIYGNISARDDDGVEPLWIRSRQNPLSIGQGEKILLEGPSRPLYGQDGCNIELYLFVANGADELTFIKGFTFFDPRNPRTKYGVAERLFNGDLGSVKVCYTTFADALYASITVFLLDGDGDESAATNVYGTISATTRRGTSELFRRMSKHEHVTVQAREPNSKMRQIPLSRAIVAVPINGSLCVKVLLQECVVDSTVISNEREIANGSVNFEPVEEETQVKIIGGEQGKIMVQVYWDM